MRKFLSEGKNNNSAENCAKTDVKQIVNIFGLTKLSTLGSKRENV